MSTVAAEILVEAHEYDGDELVRRATLERRSHDRKSVAIHAKVTVLGMSVLPGHTVDMSRAGASITVPFELAHGQACLIDLELEACGQTSTFHIPGKCATACAWATADSARVCVSARRTRRPAHSSRRF